MRAVLGLVVLFGCRQPCPPPTMISQQAAPATTPGTEPRPPDEIPTYEPSRGTPPSGQAPLVSTGKPAPSTAGTQAEIAADRHWEGEEHYRQGRYAEATSRFREAVARVPEARYFHNLCASLYMEGKFGEALTACDAVMRTNPTTEVRQHAERLSQRVKDEARSQGLPLGSP